MFTRVCSVYYQPNSSRRGDHCHGPQRTALSGLWAIPSTESGPQPPLDTYNLSSLQKLLKSLVWAAILTNNR
jgi:hypothetical protein